MQIVVAGSQGLIGTALVAHLAREGHQVRRLVRRAPRNGREIGWDPDAGRLDPKDLLETDAVVNLGGAGIGDRRWSPEYKRVILRSRTVPTGLLARTLADLPQDRPRVLLQGSAVGVYGDRGDEVLTEASAPGEDFLARVVTAWEAATAPAEDAGLRVAHLRTGILMSPRGGSFGRLLPLLRLGVGGPLGHAQNFWAWITLADHVRATSHLLTSSLRGPVNLTGPEPARQQEIVEALARTLQRPALLRVPRFALRIALGEFADDVLASQRAVPTRLQEDGFTFRHADLAAAASWVTGRPAPR